MLPDYYYCSHPPPRLRLKLHKCQQLINLGLHQSQLRGEIIGVVGEHLKITRGPTFVTHLAALPPTRALAQVAVADIGAVAVRILDGAGRFHASASGFDLASDELTGNDAVAILSRVTGLPFAYYQIPLDVIRQHMGEDVARMYEWLDRAQFAVDRAALHREFPDVAFHDFESWAKTQDWNALLQSA